MAVTRAAAADDRRDRREVRKPARRHDAVPAAQRSYGGPRANKSGSRNANRTQAADAAETVLRLAVLLQAGAAPEAAWRHLADSGDAQAAIVLERWDGDVPLSEAIESLDPSPRRTRRGGARARTGSWCDAAAAWEVASSVGAPLAESLRGMAGALRDAQQTSDDVRIALAEPAGTARLMGWLPLLGVLIGAALGFDVLGVLFTTGIGIGCLVTGIALLVASRLWVARLIRRAQPAPGTPGMHAELMAIALSAGVSIDRAQAIVEAAPGPPRPGREEVARVLELSRSAGVPAVELLRATAAHERHRARTEGRTRAARLGARLLLPLGVCTLPAFLCLGVAPMLLAVLGSTPLPALPN